MRVGLIARADNSGLGMQTWEFFNHMLPSKTLVVDMSSHNGNRIYGERYQGKPGVSWCMGIPNKGTIDEFLVDLDVVFIAEAPYNFYLYQRAREMGIKTAVQYNYEFFDWFKYPEYPKPDLLIAPSRWNYDVVERWCAEQGIKHVYLHCPVDRIKLPFRKNTQHRTFLHMVGRAAAHDRNGTETVIAASKYVKNKDAIILIHFQGEQGLGHQVTHTFDDYFNYLNEHGSDRNIMMQQQEYDNYQDVYKDADVLLLPRRYGGNCLPANEALSLGMPVIMTNISPNNAWLPKDWLVPAQKMGEFTPRMTVDIYGADPIALAMKIDEFANMSAEQVYAHNLIADGLARKIDWDELKGQYMEVLEALCKNQL